MAGLYIHIPFCKSRCSYCGFYSTTHSELRQQYVNALCKELSTIRSALPLCSAKNSQLSARLCRFALQRTLNTQHSTLNSIYLGGGTPSQLTIAQLEQLFLYINKVYPLPSILGGASEVTIECNPDDVTAEYASALPQLGINRVSMGAQTFDDQRLRFLNRRHTARQVPQAVERLRQAGIRNISIDLMYGFPDETLADWEHDIDAALSLDVEHISAYCLMLEEGTPLYEQMMKENTLSNSPCLGGELKSSLDREDLGGSEELERQMYELLIDKLQAAGYEHYEISNFAQPGFRSRHNSSYWNDIPYIGLGAAAHSYDGHCRSWNVADLKEYLRRVENGFSPVEDSELIEGWTRYNDRITVALRTCEGLDLTTLTDEQHDYCMKNARRFLDDGLLSLSDHHLALTRRGLFVSDMVMSELMNV